MALENFEIATFSEDLPPASDGFGLSFGAHTGTLALIRTQVAAARPILPFTWILRRGGPYHSWDVESNVLRLILVHNHGDEPSLQISRVRPCAPEIRRI